MDNHWDAMVRKQPAPVAAPAAAAAAGAAAARVDLDSDDEADDDKGCDGFDFIPPQAQVKPKPAQSKPKREHGSTNDDAGVSIGQSSKRKKIAKLPKAAAASNETDDPQHKKGTASEKKPGPLKGEEAKRAWQASAMFKNPNTATGKKKRSSADHNKDRTSKKQTKAPACESHHDDCSRAFRCFL